MAEQHDEWAITRRYMSLEPLAQARIRGLDPPDPSSTIYPAERAPCDEINTYGQVDTGPVRADPATELDNE